MLADQEKPIAAISDIARHNADAGHFDAHRMMFAPSRHIVDRHAQISM